ncbi:DUF3809 domain-containing protein [Deinococcus sonorensis]|uniref:DUF3809 domain-containing protein n=2 Tax=Deinococcus sonorensis TaxID=309891 RepID=A0AAU7UDF9_9DEIO
MRIEAEQTFTLPFPGSPEAALAFLRDPARALARVRFLKQLQADAAGVRAVLLVQVPMLGEVDLPLHSSLVQLDGSARLEAQPLTDERAWIELWGDGAVQPGDSAGSSALAYHFRFVAHLALPEAEQWGGAAFEKMVQAAARRTLERLTRELPEAIGRSVRDV